MDPESVKAIVPYYIWKPKEKLISVQIQFEVVDKILLEVMRGFGAVPKRGAEVGGILLGTAERLDGRIVVNVEDFEAVDCDHASGPSYIFSEDDRAAFFESLERWRRRPDRATYAVGYFRGHTRDGLCLAAEDLATLEEAFPEPTAIALVVKPFATKASIAGIFFREDGQFKADSSHLEFPFRRKELGGGTSGMERLTGTARYGQQRSGEDPRLKYRTERAPEAAGADGNGSPSLVPEYSRVASGGVQEAKDRESHRRWVWVPLSFIFLLLGVVAGFQMALSTRTQQPANSWLEAWDMALQVKRTGEELVVTWDPSAPSVRTASRGALIIQSREETRTIDLRGSQLQGGSVIYRGVPERVIFRLEVYPRERVVVSEIAEFKREP